MLFLLAPRLGPHETREIFSVLVVAKGGIANVFTLEERQTRAVRRALRFCHPQHMRDISRTFPERNALLGFRGETGPAWRRFCPGEWRFERPSLPSAGAPCRPHRQRQTSKVQNLVISVASSLRGVGIDSAEPNEWLYGRAIQPLCSLGGRAVGTEKLRDKNSVLPEMSPRSVVVNSAEPHI